MASAAVVGVGGALVSWAWPLVVIAVIGMIGIGLFAVNQFKQLRISLVVPSKESSEKLGARMHDWVYSQGLTITNASMSSAHFGMWVTDSDSRSVLIAQMKDQEEYLNLGSGILLSNEEKSWFEAADQSLVSSMREEIGIALLQLGVFYEITGSPIEKVTISEYVRIDDVLNSHILNQYINRIRRAHALTQQLMIRTLRMSGLGSPIPDRLGSQPEEGLL